MNKRRVVVTGMSMMSAGGDGAAKFVERSRNSVCGIKKNTLFSTEKLRTDYFGQIEKDYIYEIENLNQESRIESIFKDLSKQLLDDAKISVEEIKVEKNKAAFSFATSVGVNDYITASAENKITN